MATVNEIMTEAYGEEWDVAAINHTFDLVSNYRTEGRDVLVIRNASANDVHGYDESVCVANFNTLTSYWDGFDAYTTDVYSNVDMVGLLVHEEGPEDLPSILEALEGYPLLDEDEHGRVEQEMILEHWESYGRRDLHDVVAGAFGEDCYGELTDAGAEIVDRLALGGLIEFWPSMIDVSAVDFGEQEIVWPEGEKTTGLIVSILLIQLIAIFGAMFTARISKKLGNIYTLVILNLFWAILCIGAYFITKPLEFYIAAGLVGLVMGGIQALSRSTFSKMIPETDNTTSYFSFYDVSQKVSIVLGMTLFAFVDQITGSMRNSIIVFLFIFLIGAFLLKRIKIKNV